MEQRSICKESDGLKILCRLQPRLCTDVPGRPHRFLGGGREGEAFVDVFSTGLLEQRATAPLIWAVAMGYGITAGDSLLSLSLTNSPQQSSGTWRAPGTHIPWAGGGKRASELLLLLACC